MDKLTIVIPILNEANNLRDLTKLIHEKVQPVCSNYKIIFIDDHSTDNSLEILRSLQKRYPIKYFLKDGPKGKAFSIIQGAKLANSEYVIMLDGDLQYNPKYIPEMLLAAEEKKYAVVIGNREKHNEGFVRSFISWVGHAIYGKILLGMNYDTQSGLKLFRRELLSHIDTKDIKPWAFDLPLLHTAIELGEKIGQVNINFEHRKNGKSKVNFLKTATEILSTALKLKFKPKKIFEILPAGNLGMSGAGMVYKRKKFITHTTLHHSKSALITFTMAQRVVLIGLISLLAAGLIFKTYNTLIIFIGVLSVIYFLDAVFGLFLVLKSLHFPPELKFAGNVLKRLKDKDLPVYSILSPLYKEAHILPQFVKNIGKLDWPKNKLDVILLLEEDDKETVEAAEAMDLPDYFRIVVVPHSFPKTKPKACNYGLAHAKGEYVVIYDAEDMPDPLQLKKAYLGFRKSGPGVFCLQAKLNYYNPGQNLLTRLFTAEYSLWFDIVLPGLQAIETTIPLGGTSNHFRTKDLKKLEGWDPFNVAEDADLGARLFRAGYKTAIIDSITLEEANSSVKNWIRQRSRWIKGYLQTYFVQMRSPLKFAREKKQHYLIFQLVSGLRISFMVINPILWGMTLSYFLLYKYVGPQIESLFPPAVFYMAIFSTVFGNFLYIYYYMIGAAKRGEWGIIKFIFLVPFYWLLTSVAAFMAFYQLLFKPHYWEKTVHGLNKAYKKEVENSKEIEVGFLRNLGVNRSLNIRNLVNSNYLAGIFLIGASMLGNLLNFLYNAYLGRRLDLESFGLIGLVGSFVFITSIPFSALYRTVTHKSGFLFGKHKHAVKDYWRKVRTQSIKTSFVLAIVWLVLTPFLTILFQSHTIIPFLIFVPVWVMGFAAAVDGGFLAGNLLFVVTGIATITEALAKLVFSVIFVESGLHEYVYLAIPLSMSISFLFSWLYIRMMKHVPVNKEEISEIKFPVKFYISSIANNISTVAFLSLDVVMAKVFLSPSDAGRYAILSLAGKIVFMVGALFSGFITPVVSKNEGEGSRSDKAFYKLLGLTTAASGFAFVTFGIFGHITTPILFGSKVDSIIPYLPYYTFAILMQTIASTIVSFHQVKGKHLSSYIGFFFSLSQIVAMVFLHRVIDDIVLAMFVGGAVYLSAMVLLHFYYDQVLVIFDNLIDFFGIINFRQNLAPKSPKGLARILIFNWRDTKHVWSGGAEVYIQEIAKRLTQKGYKVTIFCGNDGQNPRNEKIDGVQIIRRGGFYTVYLWAFLYYIFRLRKHFDVIIDSENGIPFFTPLYARKKIFLLIHHVHQDLFRLKLRPPLSWIGKFLEKEYMPFIYRNTEVITVSPSSKADILEHKITQKEPYVIYNGVDTNIYKPGQKSEKPLILYLGRLTTQKSISVLIQAAKDILSKVPSVEIVIAGDGHDRERLMKLTKKLGLEDKVKFLGKVSEEEKINLYQKAWVFVNPSLIEGWGITTIEANACGTPVVASNVAGLRDSVHNPHSGLLVPYGNIEEFVKNTVHLLTNHKKRQVMSKESINWAKKFDWEKSAKNLIELI